MDYVELNCQVNPINPGRDIVIATLSELGFESFVETEEGVQAYIPVDIFNESALESLNDVREFVSELSYTHKVIKDQNWNAVWESNYEPVLIEDRCYIRAPFHNKKDQVEYEIVIEPQMSFGTAHHETTAMIIKLMLDEKFDGERVLDMGCGTGVLAILAGMKKAGTIVAIDNDEWAYKNSISNCEQNNFESIEVIHGDASAINGEFDCIIANINRNILLNDMNIYVNHLKSGGVLFISGFYEYDLPILQKEAESLFLKFDKKVSKNSWTAARFIKQ
jgi:ribosomal protein L11 methyltransferase